MSGGLAARGAGLVKKPVFRIQATDVQNAAMWGVAAGAAAIWIVQPFDWIKKTFLEKPASEEKSNS
uniref:Ubiquinol-cytochrome c reductase complex 6.7 kDa protein n=1 Tax=Kalanchoe fedtschenkoi TaxID=63787 RepID=A0A7N0SXB5_KALFE